MEERIEREIKKVKEDIVKIQNEEVGECEISVGSDTYHYHLSRICCFRVALNVGGTASWRPKSKS